MWHAETINTTNAPAQAIFNIWLDIPNWNTWSKSVVSSHAESQLELGAKGYIRFRQNLTANFTVTNFIPDREIELTAYLPFCDLCIRFSLNEFHKGISVKHELTLSGFATFYFSRRLGNKIRALMTENLARLILQAEGLADC